MKSIAFVLVLLLQNLIAKDDAPSVIVPNSINSCAPVPLEIKGGTPPYSVSILNAANPDGTALKEFSDVHQPSNLSWDANTIPTGTVVTFNVKDSKGSTASSSQSTVSTTCAKSASVPAESTPPATPNNASDTPQPLNTTSPGLVNQNGTDSALATPAPAAPLANSSSTANGTLLSSTSLNGPANSTGVTKSDAIMSPQPPMNAPGTNTSAMMDPPGTIPVSNPVKNTTQPQGGSVTINNNKSNSSTTKPPSSNRPSSASSSKGLPKSLHSVLLIAFIVILSAFT